MGLKSNKGNWSSKFMSKKDSLFKYGEEAYTPETHMADKEQNDYMSSISSPNKWWWRNRSKGPAGNFQQMNVSDMQHSPIPLVDDPELELTEQELKNQRSMG